MTENTVVKCWVSYSEAAVTVSRQVALIFGEGSSQATQSQDGVSLNNRTVSEEHTAHPTVSSNTQKASANISDNTAHQVVRYWFSCESKCSDHKLETHFVAALMTFASWSLALRGTRQRQEEEGKERRKWDKQWFERHHCMKGCSANAVMYK